MTRKPFYIAAFVAIALTACTSESQEAAETDTLTGGETPVEDTRTIDWTAARQARIEAIDAGQTANIVTVQGNGVGSPVPVLLPTGVVMPQNESPTYAPTQDGYFARYPGAKYDIIVNGTNEVFGVSASDMTDEMREAMVFTPITAGAQIAFSRFGADYLIEFECRFLDGQNNCVTRDEAIAVVEGLFVAAAEE